jgi:predicted dehydrogenase
VLLAALVLPTIAALSRPALAEDVKKIGIIGLDTSHVVAFTTALNTPPKKAKDAAEQAEIDALQGFRVTAAYPKGSPDIKSSIERVPEYTEKLKGMGVEIVGSIEELASKVDYVLLETNDGRPHAEQVLPVLKAHKPVFIDKPIAGSLVDALRIFEAAEHYKTPVFSSSSLRFAPGAQRIRNGDLKVGKVLGAAAYSPCSLEATHPDFYWYGIHGVETLFTVMGPGVETVTRVSTKDTDVAVGVWNDGRVGSFRGTRSGKHGYGGYVLGEKGDSEIGSFGGYRPLLVQVVGFFKSGKPPVDARETIEIYAFMSAADESKAKGGCPVNVKDVLSKAQAEAKAKPLR